VQVGGKYGYIDRAGKIVIEPRFYIPGEFHHGIAFVTSDPLDWEGHVVKKGYIDRSGKYIWGPKY